jgi:hypothetical protein
MTEFKIVDSKGNVVDSYKSLEMAREFKRIANINTPGHKVKISPTPPHKELTVGDRYIDSSGFMLTIKKIDEVKDEVLVEDLDERYGKSKAEGAPFIASKFLNTMQLLITEEI